MKVTKIRITAELQGAGIIKVITTYNESNKAFKVESLAKVLGGIIRTYC